MRVLSANYGYVLATSTLWPAHTADASNSSVNVNDAVGVVSRCPHRDTDGQEDMTLTHLKTH